MAGWNAAGLADAVPAWRTQSHAPAGPVRMLAQIQMQGSLAREGAVPAKMARSRIQYAGRNGLSCPDRQRRPFLKRQRSVVDRPGQPDFARA